MSEKTRPLKVHCAFSKMVPVAQLIPNPRNPNIHNDRQIALLAKIIKHQGWRSPIVVSKRSGFIVKGHGRLEAGKALGCEEVPVDFQDYENEATEWADMIADNRIAELSDMAGPSLKDLLQELDTGAFDMDLTGFDEADLEKMMSALTPEDIDMPSSIKEDCAFRIICCNVAELEEVKGLLKTESNSMTVENFKKALDESLNR